MSLRLRTPKIPFFAVALVALTLFAGCRQETKLPANVDDLDNIEDRVAYVIGYTQGRSLHEQLMADSVMIDRDLFMAAFRAGLRGDSLPITDDQIRTTMAAFQDTLLGRAPEARTNRLAAEAFLTQNADRDSVETLESGIQYVVLERGDGPMPRTGDVALVRYSVTPLNGQVLETTFDDPEPAAIPIVEGRIIEGWLQALTQMPQGSRWRVYIPPALGYGLQAPPQIGPNRLLVFEIQVLDVERGAGDDMMQQQQQMMQQQMMQQQMPQ
ncbi:macrophage infectivity potentiator Mip [soil metagenome]